VHIIIFIYTQNIAVFLRRFGAFLTSFTFAQQLMQFSKLLQTAKLSW